MDRNDPRELCRRLVAESREPAPPAPPRPRHVLKIPLLVALTLPDVPQPGRALHLHLWTIRSRLAGEGLWFFRTDDLLAGPTDLSPRSLTRARTQLRAANLWYVSVNPGHKVPTWYAPVWPPPLRPDAPHYLASLWLDEREVASAYSPLQALALLTRRTHPDALPLLLDVRRPASLAKLRRCHPWVALQLRWAAPELVLSPRRSRPNAQRRFDGW